MKNALIVIFFFISLPSFSQIKLPPTAPTIIPNFYEKDISFKLYSPLSYPKANLIGETFLGKVYALPVDNMPCVVTDLSKINSMPNATSNYQNSLMPNPFKKEDIIPAQ